MVRERCFCVVSSGADDRLSDPSTAGRQQDASGLSGSSHRDVRAQRLQVDPEGQTHVSVLLEIWRFNVLCLERKLYFQTNLMNDYNGLN